MDLNCINSYDNFKIVGKWGIDKNNLNIDGFLNYDNNGINLITNDSITDDFLINSERIDFIYGKGFIHINNNKFYVSHISLYKNYFSIDGIAGLSKVYNCKSKYIYMGNMFINNDINFNSCSIYLSNFSQFINGDLNINQINNIKDLNSSRKNEDNINISLNNKCIYVNKHSLLNNIIGYQLSSYINLKKDNINLSDVNKYENILSTYFSLISSYMQQVLKSFLYFNDNYNVLKLSRTPIKKVKKQDFFFELKRNIRNSEFIDIIINSLFEWINNVDELKPIYDISIVSPEIGTIDQQLSGAFSGLDMIAKHFLDDKLNVLLKTENSKLEKSKKKNKTFDMKVLVILNSFDDEIVQQILNRSRFNDKYSLCNLLWKARNGSSHSSLEYKSDYVSLEDRYMILIISQFIIRIWMLKKIKIPKDIIQEELLFNNNLQSELLF